jgi:hypothetical protein
MDTHCERVLQQIAFGYVLTPSGGMRKMYNHEMISLGREACDQFGIAGRRMHATVRNPQRGG